MLKTVIDESGHPVELCVICNKNNEPVDYLLCDGERLVPYYNDAVTLKNGVAAPPLRGVWDFEAEAWMETASAAEIAAAYTSQQPAPAALQQEDRITALEDAFAASILGGTTNV